MSLPHPNTLHAAVDRLLPADDFPSGWAAGVGDYLARHWTGDLAPVAPLIEAGLAALDAEARTRHDAAFAELTTAQQDALLADVEQGQVQHAWPVDAAQFFDVLVNLAAEGYYSDPANGGNRGAQAWRMIGYRAGPNPALTPLPPIETPQIQPTPFDQIESEYDAVVVGSGAAGGIVACVLAEAGQRVLLIERGRWQPFREVGRDHLRNHRLALYGHNTGPALDGNPRVFVDPQNREHVVQPHESGYHNNAMGVGGGTRVYGAQAWRFLPTDFQLASEYGVPEGSSLADWPISYSELESYYTRAEWEIGVAGPNPPHARSGHRSKPYPMPPVPNNPQRDVLTAGANRLGWNVAPAPLLINTAPYQGRAACVQCGMCVGFACPSESKNGTHNTAIPRALATGNCTLLTQAQVAQVETDERGKVVGVEIRTVNDAGRMQTKSVRAKRVILSAGAIESARLLLNSVSEPHPHGLGNGRDQVGRNLQGHVYTGAFGLFDEEIQDGNGPGVSLSTCEFNHGNVDARGERIIGGGMLANEFTKLPIIYWRTPLPPGVPRWGLANKQHMRDHYRRTLQVYGPTQDIPNPQARVTVDGRVRDRLGVPVARLSGVVHDETLRTASFMQQRAVEWLEASGATRVWSTPVNRVLSGGQHQAGTCRMGDDPAASVTDPWGRVHGHDNLYVIDGSLHVNNGGFNPVLTIMALAFRCAEKIA